MTCRASQCSCESKNPYSYRQVPRRKFPEPASSLPMYEVVHCPRPSRRYSRAQSALPLHPASTSGTSHSQTPVRPSAFVIPRFQRVPALTRLQARYLRFAKSSTLGFLPSSVAFSLPRATYLWGVGFLTAQFIFIAAQSVNRFVALIAGSVIAGIMLFLLYVIHPEEASVGEIFQSFTTLSCMPRLYALETPQDELMV